MKGGLGGCTLSPHPRGCSHAGGEGAARLALQIDAEAVGVLGMLEQEPGTSEGLLACGAGVTAGLIFIWRHTEIKHYLTCKNDDMNKVTIS